MTRRAQWLTVLAVFVASMVAFSVTVFTGDHSHAGEEGILLGSALVAVAICWAFGLACTS